MVISRTPFRISFFGGGTDYPVWYTTHGGAVLSTSINKYCYVTCRYSPLILEKRYKVAWSKVESVNDVEEIEHPVVRETIKLFELKEGVEVHYIADLPARTGMGSSSSFTVGLIHALHALLGKTVSKNQLAKEAIRVERELLKENVGSQDQVAAAFGGLNKITFNARDGFSVHPIVLSPEKLATLESNLLLLFTGFSRNTSEISQEQIKNTPLLERELTRMTSIVDEAIEILNDSTERLDDFGRLLDEAWRLKRSFSSVITRPEIDEIYEAGKKAGALGGKLLGAGGGGFMLFYAKPEVHDAIRKALKKFFFVPFQFEHAGSQIIHYHPD